LREERMTNAPDILRKAADLIEERGKQYDSGERSMARAVKAFNAIVGRSAISEEEGWLLLQVLKDVRQWQNPDKAHRDSLEDCAAYAALKAEAYLSKES
jgi:tRNA C32,U32 (ribose-2'-O)-methylase TrmJ